MRQSAPAARRSRRESRSASPRHSRALAYHNSANGQQAMKQGNAQFPSSRPRVALKRKKANGSKKRQAQTRRRGSAESSRQWRAPQIRITNGRPPKSKSWTPTNSANVQTPAVGFPSSGTTDTGSERSSPGCCESGSARRSATRPARERIPAAQRQPSCPRKEAHAAHAVAARPIVYLPSTPQPRIAPPRNHHHHGSAPIASRV